MDDPESQIIDDHFDLLTHNGERSLRLECLRMAADREGIGADEILPLAQTLYDWVMGESIQ